MQLPPELTAHMFFSLVDKAGGSRDKAVAAGDKTGAMEDKTGAMEDKTGAMEDKAVAVDEGAFLTAHRHARALFEGHLRDSERDSGALLPLWERQSIEHIAYMRGALAELLAKVDERIEALTSIKRKVFVPFFFFFFFMTLQPRVE